MTTTKMSKIDKEIFSIVPKDKWFEADSLPFWVRNREHRCHRLKDLGKLKSKFIISSNKFMFRVAT